MVPRTGLEPARLAALAPETSASTIPPPGHLAVGYYRNSGAKLYIFFDLARGAGDFFDFLFFFGGERGVAYIAEAYELEARGAFAHYVESVWFGHYRVALGGYCAGEFEDVSGDGLIVVVFGDVELEAFVDVGYLASAGEFVYAGLYLFCG